MNETLPTDQEIIDAVKNNVCKGDILKLFNRDNIGHYRWLNSHIKRLNLSTDHFLSNSELSKKSFLEGGRVFKQKISNEDLFNENSCCYSSITIKSRLLRNDLVEKECSICGIIDWNDQPLSLQLDHINGKPMDNRIENLRLLCPNCHSQTSTFCAKNKKGADLQKNKCINCNSPCGEQSTRCSVCRDKNRLLNGSPRYPSDINILIKEVEESSYSAVGRKYDVSDNAIRKYIKRRQNMPK